MPSATRGSYPDQRRSGHREQPRRVRLADRDRELGHARRGERAEQAAGSAFDASALRGSADHEPEYIDQEHHRQTVRAAQRDEPRRLVSRLHGERTGAMLRAVGDDPERDSIDTAKRRGELSGPAGPQLEGGPVVQHCAHELGHRKRDVAVVGNQLVEDPGRDRRRSSAIPGGVRPGNAGP